MISTSSFETSSFNTTEQELSTTTVSDDLSVSDPALLEVRQYSIRAKQETKRFEKEILQGEKYSKKWAKTQVETLAAIKEAELTTKQYDLERAHEEFQTDLANKEAEFDSKIREIDAVCNELRTQVHQFEIELGEVKDRRKHDLMQVRVELESSLREMEQKKIAHSNQIGQLQDAYNALVEKHKKDISIQNEESETNNQLIEMDLQRVTAEIERVRRVLAKTDQIQTKRISESTQAIEMLNREIDGCKNRTAQILENTENVKNQYSQMQANLMKQEEHAQIFSAQLEEAEREKAEMRTEFNKLNRSLWNERRARLIRN